MSYTPLHMQSTLTEHAFTRRRRIRGTFSGSRLEFLQDWLPRYFEAVDTHELPTFWPMLHAEYWTTFPWRLPIDVEPHCGPECFPDKHPLSHEDLDKRTFTRMQTHPASRARFSFVFKFADPASRKSAPGLPTSASFARAACCKKPTDGPDSFKVYLTRPFRSRSIVLEMQIIIPRAPNCLLPMAPPFKILHSGEWWKDFHRARAARAAARRHPRAQFDPPVGDQGRIYTFILTRTAPLLGAVQNDGRFLMTTSDPSAPRLAPGPRPLFHAPPLPFQSNAAKRAQAAQLARPSPEDELLARLRQTPEQRRRRELRSQIHKAVGPLEPAQREKKVALAAKQKRLAALEVRTQSNGPQSAASTSKSRATLGLGSR
ncbi:hypothetical protein C8R46DRAFT_1041101 [Mycena filopes]|nr:hypothetical protein C8R46DRAFT_1041101 [Mycena filopes]